MRKNLTKQERLKGKTSILKVFSARTRVKCTGAKLIYIENELGINRVLFTFIKKYGNAVQRNKTRRQLKEIYRNMKNSLKTGYDMIFILYPGKFNYSDRKYQTLSLFKKAALFKKSTKTNSL